MAKTNLPKNLGESTYLPEGNDWSYGQPCMMIRCAGGYIMARNHSDRGCYSELFVDFVSDDDRLVQLAVVGRDECDDEWPVGGRPEGYQPMHVYAYDGTDECVTQTQYVTIGEDSYWYDK